MSSLREALETAFEQPAEEAVETTVEVSETVEAAPEPDPAPVEEGRARDESGKFVAKDKEEATADVVEELAAEAPPPRKAPSSWKPAAQEAFLKADRGEPLTGEEIRLLTQEAERRENDFHKGVSEWKSHADKARAYEQAVTPFNGYLQQIGVDAPTAISHLLKTEHTLRTADPITKANEFARLAREYGVDLSQIEEPPQHDPQTQYLMSELKALRDEQQRFYNQTQQHELAKAQTIIEQMANDSANFPHFEAVRGDMADLLETGKATSEKEAYEMAVWMRPDTRTTLLDQQRAEAQRKAIDAAQVQKAKAASVSVKGSSPVSSGVQPVKGSLRSQLEAAFADR
jgi:hypothetical protein